MDKQEWFDAVDRILAEEYCVSLIEVEHDWDRSLSPAEAVRKFAERKNLKKITAADRRRHFVWDAGDLEIVEAPADPE